MKRYSFGEAPRFQNLSDNDGHLRIGAGATLWDLEVSSRFDRAIPTLRQAIAQIGNVRVRMKGTVGGNIMARNSSFEVAPILMALNAQQTFVTSGNEQRKVSIESLAGPNGHVDAIDGLLLDVCIPTTGKVWLGYDRSLRPAISLATGVRIDSGNVIEVRVGIACAYPTVFSNVVELPQPLEIGEMRDAARPLSKVWADNLPPPMADDTASSEYRRRLAAILLCRQLGQFSSTWYADG